MNSGTPPFPPVFIVVLIPHLGVRYHSTNSRGAGEPEVAAVRELTALCHRTSGMAGWEARAVEPGVGAVVVVCELPYFLH